MKYIVYDGECPFCSAYVRMLRLRETIGPVELVSARTNHPVVARLHKLGFDLDEGMAYVDGEQISYGDECINKLALMSTSSGAFNWVNSKIFASPLLSRILYPIMRVGRNTTLRLMGRVRIKDSPST